MVAPRGSVPERPKGADCKSAGTAYEGSNPSRPTLRISIPAGRSPGSLCGPAVHLPGRRLSLQWRYECVRRVSSRPGGREAQQVRAHRAGASDIGARADTMGLMGRTAASARGFDPSADPGRGARPRPLDDVGRGGAPAVAVQRARRSRPRARSRARRRVAPARAARRPRVHRRHRHHAGVDPPGLAVRVEAPRGVVLRCPRRRRRWRRSSSSSSGWSPSTAASSCSCASGTA